MKTEDTAESPSNTVGRNVLMKKFPVRIALLDVGTNSIKFLIAEVGTDLNARTVFFSRVTTRLGAGSKRDYHIRREALERTVDALAGFQRRIIEYGCSNTFAFATHAFRAAANARQAVSMVERQTGIRLRILTSEEEASYAFTSAERRLALKRPHTILIDIGGGSTEFVYARNRKIQIARSLPLGAIPLTESYLKSDPVTAEEFRSLALHIERTVKNSKLLPDSPAWRTAELDLVVSGGAVWTLAQMVFHIERTPRQSYPSNKIKRHQLQSFLNKCLPLTVNERKQIKGLEPDRADIIVAGLAVVLHFMSVTGKRVLIANEGGVREGVLQAIIQNSFRWPGKKNPKAIRKADGLR